MSVSAVSWDQVRCFRMERHHLLEPSPREALADVVRDICGVQAQVSTSAALALRARVRGATRDDIDGLLWDSRRLVKTWCMRGTAHLLPAVDLPVYLGAVGEAIVGSEQRWMSRDGLSPDEACSIVDAVASALSSGPLTRRELGECVQRSIGPDAARWVQTSWGGVVKQVCLRGVACFGPDRGPEITFTLLREWLPDYAPAEPRGALDQLLVKYLHSYGPATTRDFSAWSGVSARDATAAAERLTDPSRSQAWDHSLSPVTVEGKTMLAVSSDVEAIEAVGSGGCPVAVRLLPGFDQFLLGHADKGWLVDPAHYSRVFRKAGWISPVVLVGGRVAGVWSHASRGRRARVSVELFEDASAGFRARGRSIESLVEALIQAEVEDVERFLNA